jgi:hypothetical protein
MKTVLDVDGITFTFGDEWKASQYDEWTFFRNKMSNIDAKGVDIVAVRSARELHLIEVKDYTHPETATVPLGDLPLTIAAKCKDTLGGLAAARLRALDDEQELAVSAMRVIDIRVTLHIELAKKSGRLHNPSKVKADLQTKLRLKLKAIDPHASLESNDKLLGHWDAYRTHP